MREVVGPILAVVMVVFFAIYFGAPFVVGEKNSEELLKTMSVLLTICLTLGIVAFVAIAILGFFWSLFSN
jgi:hypothetical protein